MSGRLGQPKLFDQAVRAQQRGELATAESLYLRLLKKMPDFAPAWVNLGQLRRQNGDEAGAIESYQQALKLPNPPIELHFNLANLYMARGEFDASLVSNQQLLSREPQHPAALQQRSRALRELGRLEEASAVLEQLLNAQPKHHDALLERGNLERTLQRPEVARRCFEALLDHDADDWKGHYALARLLFEGDELDLAEHHLSEAVRQSGEPAVVLLPMARTYVSDGRYQEAQSILDKLLKLSPDHAYARLELGLVLTHLGDTQAGEEIFQRLSASEDIALLTRLAEVSMDLKHWRESLALLRRVVTLAPERPEVYFNLASSCAAAWQLTEALEVSRRCSELADDPGAMHSLIGSIHLKRGDVEAALAAFRLDQATSASKQVARLNFASLYSDQISAQDNFQQHRHSAGLLESEVEAVAHWNNDVNPDRRLRLGYVSADLHRQHPVDIYMQPVFEAHDRSGFHVTIYYNGVGYDDRTRRAKSVADRWVEVQGWPDERLMRQIENDAIDILIDLSGHTARNRLTLFARHPAPVQLSMVAYPHTTGLEAMDYLLGDPVLTPPEMAHLYREKLLCLDRCIFCYPDDLHPANEMRDKRDAVVFGSFNNVPKLTPATIRVWADILRAVPQSRLLLKAASMQDPGCVARYQGLFRELGIGAERLMFRGLSGLDEMMREYRDIDIALDPFPFNGGTTTQQALWAGTPLVTMAGKSFHHRMGASIVTHLGHPEWVARSEEEYVAIATELARDTPRLRKLHQEIPREMRDSGLTDSRAYTQNLEQLLRRAWGHWCRRQVA